MTTLPQQACGRNSAAPQTDAAPRLAGLGHREPDLFGHVEQHYPDRPGFKSATSRESAHKIAGHAKAVRNAALAEFIAIHPNGLTADELARRLHHSILTVRPRVSELRAAALVEPTPERRRNESGHGATVWRAAPPALRKMALDILAEQERGR
jgi:hypothetical protein